MGGLQAAAQGWVGTACTLYAGIKMKGLRCTLLAHSRQVQAEHISAALAGGLPDLLHGPRASASTGATEQAGTATSVSARPSSAPQPVPAGARRRTQLVVGRAQQQPLVLQVQRGELAGVPGGAAAQAAAPVAGARPGGGQLILQGVL